MVENELIHRKNSRIKRLLKAASLTLNACVEDIDYTNRTIDKKLIQTLASCAFIEQKLNIIISGKTGCVKSYLACALGNNACRREYSVKYYRVPELHLELQNAKNENNYPKFMKRLQNIKFFSMIGLKDYSQEESRDMLDSESDIIAFHLF